MPGKHRAPIRALLACAEPLWGLANRLLFGAHGEVELVGGTGDGREVERLARELAPDVLLLDPNLPGPPASDLLYRLRQRCPGVHVLVVAEGGEEARVQRILAAGAAGHVLAGDTPRALVAAVRAVAGGQPQRRQGLRNRAGLPARRAQVELSKRQVQVLSLLARGWSDDRIATELDIGRRTIRLHVRNACDKLGLGTRAEAVAWAAREGLASAPGAGAEYAAETGR